MADPRLSNRVANITESSTLAIDAKAKALKAAGENIIGFGAGEPDFPTPRHIVEAAAAACSDPVNHHYTPAGGLPRLREAIAVKTARDSAFEVTPDRVLVSNGGKHALYNAFLSVLDPGDEVIVPAPYWVSYPEMIRLADGVPVELPATEATGFRVTIDQLEATVTPKTKALLFVSPSNPTGAVYPRDEIEAIGWWAVERGLWVVTDEIYEHLVYGGSRHHSMPVLVPELADRCLVINGVAKTYAMTGWRVGWVIGPAHLIKGAASLQSHATSNVSNVAQVAALAAVSGDLSAAAEMRASFDRRRITMHKMLNEIEGVSCYEPEGAFYCFPNFTGVIGREIAGTPITDTLTLTDVALTEARVAMVPGDGFGAPGYMRLSYALGDDDIVEGVTRVAELLS